MVIKRSPGGEFAGGGRSTWNSTCEVPGWLHLAIDQHPVCPNLAPAWTLTSEFDRINWPLTSGMFTFWICTRVLQWPCLKAVSVSTFVLGGLRGFTAISDLVTGQKPMLGLYFLLRSSLSSIFLETTSSRVLPCQGILRKGFDGKSRKPVQLGQHADMIY